MKQTQWWKKSVGYQIYPPVSYTHLVFSFSLSELPRPPIYQSTK